MNIIFDFMGQRCFVILLLIYVICACNRNDDKKDDVIIDYAFTELTGDVLLYSDGMYNAFTDLCVYNGKYYLCFRNSKNHASIKREDYGRVFVYMSHEGEIWNKICEISDPDSDLRDPKLIVDKYNRLVLYCGYSKIIDNELVFQGTKAGIIDSTVILQEVYRDRWLWRVTWYKGCAYSFAYRRNKMYLLKSDNGFDWSPMENVEISDCNEAALYFREDKGCVIARTTYGKTLLGRADKPYYNWNFDTLALEMHCPAILYLNSEKIYCAGRICKSFQMGEAAALFKLDNMIVDTLWQSSFAADAGYPGIITQDDQVIISYYSGDGIKSDIYLKKFFIRPIYAE